jgi:hypothetical protein
MNVYRVRAHYRCHGFILLIHEHFDANSAAQAIKKGIQKFEAMDELPATDELMFISSFFVRKLDAT